MSLNAFPPRAGYEINDAFYSFRACSVKRELTLITMRNCSISRILRGIIERPQRQISRAVARIGDRR